MPIGRRRPAHRTSKIPLRVTSYRPADIHGAAASPTDSLPVDRTAILAQLKSSKRRTAAQNPLPVPPIVTPESFLMTLPLPPSINHQYATVNGRRLLSSAGRAYKTQVSRQVWMALAQSPVRTEIMHRLQTQPLALSIRFFFTSALRRDVDGGLKIAQDAVCEGLGLNDNRIVETHLYKDLDKTNPRIEVALSPTCRPSIATRD